LRALTAGRARSTVDGYTFITLNSVVGVVRVAEGGSVFNDEDEGHGTVYDEMVVEKQREKELMESGTFADIPTRNQARGDAHEAFRFTIADNPGLIEDASDNVGLEHSFSAVYGTNARAHLRCRSFWPRTQGRASHASGRAVS
jgi:GTPase